MTPSGVAAAAAYRRLVLAVLGQVAFGVTSRAVTITIRRAGADDTGGALVLSFGFLLIALVLLIGVAVNAYAVVTGMDLGKPALWAVAMCVPCANLIVLLLLNSRATAWCRERGIEVGLFGPTRQSLERLRSGRSAG